MELNWGAVTGASSYVILWDDNQQGPTYENKIEGIEETRYSHTGLTNLLVHHYKIVAATSGGRGPKSRPVEAVPGPVPGPVEWVAVTTQAPGHTIYFGPAEGATHYRVYFAAAEPLLAGRWPAALYVEANTSPAVRDDVGVTAPIYYRVIAMNDSRIGVGGPAATSPTAVITEHELDIAGVAFGLTDDDDDCLDLPTGTGGVSSEVCTAAYSARDLEDAGLEDLVADPRRVSDVRLADFNGDGLDDLFSNTDSSVNLDGSVALLHLNQGDGVFQTSASVQALSIGGVGGTLLAADFDNDGDVDIFAPHDQTRGGAARNWFLVNAGAGVFTDQAAAASLQTDPPGVAYVPNGGQALDFDEDGFVDLLFGSRLMLNNGDGTFRDGSAAANLPVLADQGLRVFDLDLDGDLDLVHHSGVETRVFRNVAGVFDGGELVGTEAEDTYGSGLVVCDINGDGFEDIMVARNLSATNRGTPKRLVNVNGSLLLSATQEASGTDEDGLIARNERLACGDQNADGMADVLARWGESYRLMRGAVTLSRHIVLRVVDGNGQRNQQGRVVRVAPVDFPHRVMARVVESGSGLRSQGQYDLLVGAPWPGDYEVTVRFADGEVTTTVEAGDRKIIFADGRVEDIDEDEG